MLRVDASFCDAISGAAQGPDATALGPGLAIASMRSQLYMEKQQIRTN